MIFAIVLFIILGIVFMMGKGSFLIAGFNTMSKEKKAQYDVEALCRFMGLFMFAVAFSLLLWFADEYYPDSYLDIIGQVLFFAVILYALVYVNTGKRFKKKE